MRSGTPTKLQLTFLLAAALACCAHAADLSLKETMDRVVARLYANMDETALGSIDHETALKLLTDEERRVLATQYWTFDVNVPVVVSVMRNTGQKPVPFWLPEAGFRKTDLRVKNEIWTYEVWQKAFDTGRVELGINGFGMHRTVYFVCVGPQKPGDEVKISNLFPAGEAVTTMKKGAWTYRDWDSLVIEELPQSLAGQLLLTTFRGRAREAHLVGGFRKTPFPSSKQPDQIVLTWSDDPRTTQTVQWRSSTAVQDGVVRYRPLHAKRRTPAEARAKRVVIEDRLLMNDRYTHGFTAVLRDLKPSTEYVYTVGPPGTENRSEEATFKTAPAAKSPFSFVYHGDTHRSPIWGRMLQAADRRHSDVAFHIIGGDLVSTGLFRNEWDELLHSSADVFARKPLAFSLGNHDDQDGLGAWMPLALFEFPHNGPKGIKPEKTYSFRYGDALFLVLDVASPYEAQAEWMAEQLAKTDATWRFGIYHFPMYVWPEHDEYGPIRRRWEKVFAEHHLDMMLHGHIHCYLRTRPMRSGRVASSPAEGTIYLISSGVPTDEKPKKLPDYAVRFLVGGPWYVKFDIDGNRLVCRTYDTEGNVHDEWTIEK